MDSNAIADAIATRFAAAAVTPPSGQEEPKVVTADLPESITFYPTILVGPEEMANASYNASRNRSFDLLYPVICYLSRSDGTPRRVRAARAWATALYGQLGGQLQLGLSSYVALCYIASYQVGTMTYGGQEHDGVRFEVLVRVSEAYTPVA